RMRGKGILILALLAMLTLAVSATMGPAAGASKGGATVAKKKCKKKKKTSSASAAKKKKKCKKKGTGGGGGTTPNPVVRATLSWTGGGSNTDYDLYVFDGATTARAGSDPIPNTGFSANAKGTPGTETFTDNNFVPGSGRTFQFGVCKQDGGNDGSTYNIDYVTADGVHHPDTQSGHGDGYAAKYSGNPPPVAPNGFAPCPAP